MTIKTPTPGRLYKIIKKVNFVPEKNNSNYFDGIQNEFFDKGHVIFISFAPAGPRVGYRTYVWWYILPDMRKAYHHISEIEGFWEHFEEV